MRKTLALILTGGVIGTASAFWDRCFALSVIVVKIAWLYVVTGSRG